MLPSAPEVRQTPCRRNNIVLRLIPFLAIVLAVMSAIPPAYSVQPEEILSDPGLERRARDISLDLRCLVCQNQSIDDSDAPLAKDLRVLVRDRLTQGDSNEQVIDFIVDRYGEFVLLRPRFGSHTLILWLSAPLLLIIGLMVLFRSYRSNSGRIEQNKTKKLTAAEKRELNRLLKKS